MGGIYKQLSRWIYQWAELKDCEIWCRFNALSQQLQNIRTVNHPEDTHTHTHVLRKTSETIHSRYIWHNCNQLQLFDISLSNVTLLVAWQKGIQPVTIHNSYPRTNGQRRSRGSQRNPNDVGLGATNLPL